MMPFSRLFSTFGISFGTASGAVLESFDISFRSCICRYTWHPSYAACTYRHQWLGALARYLLVCLPLLRQVYLLTLRQVAFWFISPVHLHVHLSSVVYSVNLSFPIAGCARWLSSGVLATSSSGTLVDSTSGRFLDSSQGVLAMTCLSTLIAVLWVRYVDCSCGALVATSHLNWWMRFAVHRSSTSGMLIVCGRGCSWFRYSYSSLFLKVVALLTTNLGRLCRVPYHLAKFDLVLIRKFSYAVASVTVRIAEAESASHSAL